MDHLISASRPNQDIVNKKKKRKEKKKRTCHIVYFVIPVNHCVKIKENEKTDKYFDLARELSKLWYMNEDDGDTNCNWRSWNGL